MRRYEFSKNHRYYYLDKETNPDGSTNMKWKREERHYYQKIPHTRYGRRIEVRRERTMSKKILHQSALQLMDGNRGGGNRAGGYGHQRQY